MQSVDNEIVLWEPLYKEPGITANEVCTFFSHVFLVYLRLFVLCSLNRGTCLKTCGLCILNYILEA